MCDPQLFVPTSATGLDAPDDVLYDGVDSHRFGGGPLARAPQHAAELSSLVSSPSSPLSAQLFQSESLPSISTFDYGDHVHQPMGLPADDRAPDYDYDYGLNRGAPQNG